MFFLLLSCISVFDVIVLRVTLQLNNENHVTKPGMKLLTVDKSLAEKHYADLSAKPFFQKLVNYIVSGPVVAMVWEGKNVVTTGRKLIGATNPCESAPGTIRGDFAIDMGRTSFLLAPIILYHAS